jgi:hypothetical protein
VKIHLQHHSIKTSGTCLALLLLMLWAISCNQTNTDPVDVYQYYPLELGRYQIYQVKETVYSAGQKNPVITSWQEKDQVDRISSNSNDVTTYIVARYKRVTSVDYWQKIKEYSVTKSPDKILTNLDNLTVFSLIFPPSNQIKWNGNTYNNMEVMNYRYQQIGSPSIVDKQTFDKTLTVLERKDTSAINRYVGIKKYALGTGLILDEQTAYEYCQDEDCIGEEIIESGTYKIRTIIESGILQ